jgi:hypothetical protein
VKWLIVWGVSDGAMRNVVVQLGVLISEPQCHDGLDDLLILLAPHGFYSKAYSKGL